jgi:hypothetical protein
LRHTCLQAVFQRFQRCNAPCFISIFYYDDSQNSARQPDEAVAFYPFNTRNTFIKGWRIYFKNWLDPKCAPAPVFPCWAT